MKVSTTLLVLTSFVFTVASDAQVKKGGLFGFGKNSESELSSELFPNVASETAVPVADIEEAIKPPKKKPAGFNIFKGGQPKEVDEVSYVIENGERIETEAAEKVEKQKKGLFSFGKQKADDAAGEVIDAIPSAPEGAAPVTYQTPTVATTSSVATMSEEALAAIDSTGEAATQASTKKGGFFSKFGKKKDPVVATGPSVVNVSEVMGIAPAAEEATPAPAPASVPEAPKPVAPAPAPREVTPIVTTPSTPAAAETPAPTTTAASNDPVPQFEGTTTSPTEEKKEGGFFSNPINKLRPSKKAAEVDLTGAETIIQNGEIVAGSATAAVDDAVTEVENTMPRQAPQVINGAKTYSSWDDIEATEVSAADKILSQMR